LFKVPSSSILPCWSLFPSKGSKPLAIPALDLCLVLLMRQVTQVALHG